MTDKREMRLMEVCGTHTAAIFKSGLRSLLPTGIKLVSGPGCPVCVTPSAYIDKCVSYAMRQGHALVSFGDMLKVPGTGRDAVSHVDSGVWSPRSLDEAKGAGGRVEMVYSPFEVPRMAGAERDTVFIIAAVGFETTAPAYALLLDELIEAGITNVRLLTSLRSAVRAIEWVCENEKGIDGFLCPGHVSVITGSAVYEPLAERYGKPFVVGGFEPRHISEAVYELIDLARAGAPAVVNRYAETVSAGGNAKARAAMDRYFEPRGALWRGLGEVADSGYYLRGEYAAFDAGSFDADADEPLPEGCRCADVITGRIDPDGCPLFATLCAPGHAVGPCMVSAEGACGIWYRNR
jgi:hydrogenase expression/formation protein HypD